MTLGWGLSAFLLILLMAGCAHNPPAPQPPGLEALVHEKIADPVRAEKVLVLMRQTAAGISALKETNERVQQEIVKLNADYNATPEQFSKQQAYAGEARRRLRQEILEAYFQIKALTTPQEWEWLSGSDRESLKEFIKKTEVPDEELNAPPSPGSQTPLQGSTGVVREGRTI